MLRSLLRTLRYLVGHPVHRGRPWGAVRVFADWQLRKRTGLLALPCDVPFVNGSRFAVAPGSADSVGVVYVGLNEFWDQGFAMHFLRAGDLFVDGGANCGTYTVAVGAATDAEIIAIEPVPATFATLQRNVALNGLATRVSCLNIALGAQPGRVRMTASHDSMNAVIHEDVAVDADAIDVATDTLDRLLGGRSPTMLKLDVEGYEWFALAGATELLQRPALTAVIVELNGTGSTYGVADAEVHRLICEAGFSPVAYSPITRELRDLAGRQSPLGNTVYVRNLPEAQARLRSAPPFTIRDRSF